MRSTLPLIALLALLTPVTPAVAAGDAQAPPAAVQPGFDGLARYRDVVDQLRREALQGGSAGFELAATTLESRARDARDVVDLLPVYRDLLAALGDRHSFVQASEDLLAAHSARTGQPLYPPVAGPRWTSTLTGRPIGSRLAPLGGEAFAQVIVVPAMEGGGRRASANAQVLHDATLVDQGRACGAVVDLRGNIGGNAWSMLLGLSSLIGEGDYGRSVDARGTSAAYASLSGGAVIVLEGEYAGQAMARLETPPSDDAVGRPIAVLIDDATASSGEQVAIELIGRDTVRVFGQRTYGVASSNLGVPAGDDVNLVVTTAWMQDRQGRTWPDGVEPDVEVRGAPEVVLEAALAWLSEQPGCRSAFGGV